jgi:hypothetical protein
LRGAIKIPNIFCSGFQSDYHFVSLQPVALEQGVCHTVTLPPTLKSILRQTKELWKLKYFSMQKYKVLKNPLKETKVLQDIKTL